MGISVLGAVSRSSSPFGGSPLIVSGLSFVATARGEQEYFDPAGVATASEAAKSNALMRCCKDLGIAHELWSPRWIRNFKAANCVEVWTENASTGRK